MSTFTVSGACSYSCVLHYDLCTTPQPWPMLINSSLYYCTSPQIQVCMQGKKMHSLFSQIFAKLLKQPMMTEMFNGIYELPY